MKTKMKTWVKTKLVGMAVVIILLGFMSSCSQNGNGISPDLQSYDTELIASIQNASSTQTSTVEALPTLAQETLSAQFTEEDVAFVVKKVEGYGYEVTVRKNAGLETGQFVKIYFDESGKELSKDCADKSKKGKGKKGKGKKHKDGFAKECFDIVYPITLTMPDQSTISVASDDETGWAAVKAWYESNPESEDKPALNYPIDVVLSDGTTQTLNSEDELNTVIASCDGFWGEKKKHYKGFEKGECFDIVYPITLTMPDQSTISVASDDEAGWAAVKAWYEANSSSKEKPAFNYPIQISLSDGTTQTLNSEDELKQVFEDCKTADDTDND